jgi:hypothetical protein
VPLLLVALASTGAGCSLGGDGTVFVSNCAHFVATVRTSKPGYAPGQTVIISVSQANDGPVCTTPPQPCGGGPPWAVASAYGPAGEDVWDAGARKTIPTLEGATCLPGPVPNMTWPPRSSETQIFDWSQDKCAQDETSQPGHANPDCPGTQLAAGTYRIAGRFYWSDGPTHGRGPSASATITISG